METLLAVGNASVIEPLLADTVHASKDDVFLISASDSERQTLRTRLEHAGARLYTYAQFQNALHAQPTQESLTPLTTADAFAWLRTGMEFFGVLHADIFELCSVQRKEVAAVRQIENVVNTVIGNQGAILACVHNSRVSFRLAATFELIYDVPTATAASAVVFDDTDRFAAILTGTAPHCQIALYEILRGRHITTLCGDAVAFAGVTAKVAGRTVVLDEQDGLKEAVSAISMNPVEPGAEPDGTAHTGMTRPKSPAEQCVARDGRLARFIPAAPQRIIYEALNKRTEKIQSNISAVQFYFSETKLYAHITKRVGDAVQHAIESYHDGEITITRLPAPPVSIAVTDRYFVVLDLQRKLTFYTRDRYAYVPSQTLDRDGSGLVSACGAVVCAYDAFNRSLEFYDDGHLRTVYTRSDCCGLSWSPSGLYLAAYTFSEMSGAQLQIFSANGDLLFSKVYNRLTAFQWRRYPTLPLLAAETEDSSETAADGEEDVAVLLSQWKAYLLSKRQILKELPPSEDE